MTAAEDGSNDISVEAFSISAPKVGVFLHFYESLGNNRSVRELVSPRQFCLPFLLLSHACLYSSAENCVCFGPCFCSAVKGVV